MATSRRSPKLLRLAAAKPLHLLSVQARRGTGLQQLGVHLAQGGGGGLKSLGGGILLSDLRALPAFPPFSLLLPPGIHSLLVEILLGLLVVDGEAPLLLRIERTGSGAGDIGSLANGSQRPLSRFKTLQQAGQTLLMAGAQREQALLFSQALPLLGQRSR